MLGISAALLISRIITLLIAFTVHEFSHAWTANYFGDSTARLEGRLTLNPAAHLDIFGTLMLLLVGFGWAKPVPINPYVLQRRSKYAVLWVSLAGPLSNFFLAALAAIPLRFNLVPQVTGWPTYLPTPESFLFTFVTINILLMLFNLIPLAPLDGEKIAYSLFPPSLARVFDQIRPYSSIILLALIFLLPRLGVDVLGVILYPIASILLRLLIGV